MAVFKTLNKTSFALIVLILAAFLFTSSEGRRALSFESIKGATTHHGTDHATTTISTSSTEHRPDSDSIVIDEKDFRPTTPGHGPGAGH